MRSECSIGESFRTWKSDSEPLDFLVQGRRLDSKEACGLALHPSRANQRLLYQLALESGDRLGVTELAGYQIFPRDPLRRPSCSHDLLR